MLVSTSFPQPIDFLVFDDRAWQMVDEASFREITYDAAGQDLARGTPSDHCPIAVTVDLGAADDGEDDEPSDTDTTDLDLLYEPAEGLEGEDLRRVLHEIARQGHSRLSYAEVWSALDITDEDPDNADNVILLYTGRSHYLCTLLAWRQADPVDDLERRRHERIVETQGNRNPFIDRPKFAVAIWGSPCGV